METCFETTLTYIFYFSYNNINGQIIKKREWSEKIDSNWTCDSNLTQAWTWLVPRLSYDPTRGERLSMGDRVAFDDWWLEIKLFGSRQLNFWLSDSWRLNLSDNGYREYTNWTLLFTVVPLNLRQFRGTCHRWTGPSLNSGEFKNQFKNVNLSSNRRSGIKIE